MIQNMVLRFHIRKTKFLFLVFNSIYMNAKLFFKKYLKMICKMFSRLERAGCLNSWHTSWGLTLRTLRTLRSPWTLRNGAPTVRGLRMPGRTGLWRSIREKILPGKHYFLELLFFFQTYKIQKKIQYKINFLRSYLVNSLFVRASSSTILTWFKIFSLFTY